MTSSDLAEIRDIIKNRASNFNEINETLRKTTDGLNKIENTYTIYGEEIDDSRKHINKLKRKEFFESLFIYIGFYFFLSCACYIILKRFPLSLILRTIYFSIYSIIDYCYSFFNSFNNYINEQVNNTLLNNTIPMNTTIKRVVKNATKIIKNNISNLNKTRA